MTDIIHKTLAETDSELCELIEQEHVRQRDGLELIASENFTSQAVMECLGSVLTNKYSEGLPGKRYYGGNEIIDKIENLCITRSLQAFQLNPDEWGVNTQPYSGSVANMAAYAGLIQPNDRLMGLDLPSGGHLTHGFQTAKRKISLTSAFFVSKPYTVDDDGWIDYQQLEQTALEFKPKLIICGYSAYSRDLDYRKFRQIADRVNAYLLCDMAHISGFVVTGELSSPFAYCDVVTTTTHKTLRGPRAGLIFYRKQFENQINNAVFPGLQGGPHQHQIAAIATQMKQVTTPDFKRYIQQVRSNAQTMATELIRLDYKVLTGGTDNHIILLDLRNKGVTGSKVEMVCEQCHISLNKNAVKGDKSALSPGGVRIGTPALTTRGMMEVEAITVAVLFHQCVELAQQVGKVSGVKLRDFTTTLNKPDYQNKISEIRESVKQLSGQFIDVS